MPAEAFTAVLFDFDGTLANTAQDVWASVAVGFAATGLALPAAFAADGRHLALTVEQMVARLYPGAAPAQAQQAAMATAHHYRTANTCPHTALYPGIESLLKQLRRKGVPMGVLSNKGHAALGRLLRTKGWAGYFTRWRGVKPQDADAQDKCRRLARFLRHFDTARAVYVGDSPGDVAAAQANGLHSVGVLYGDGDSNALAAQRPDALLASPGALRDYLLKQLDGEETLC